MTILPRRLSAVKVCEAGKFSWRMLANVLAVLLGSGSVIFYLAAFFYPEVHRRSDFLWSGLGLFYAVVLWFCAGQMTGAVLLGQMTAVTLLLGLGWQTLTVRREKTPVYQQTPVVLTPEIVGNWAKNKLNQLRIAPATTVPVRLEKRKLGDRLDPRRRPLYEYEFVEDGVGDLEPLLEPSAAAIIEAIAQPPLPAIEAAAEPTDAAPPSADAEILLVEGPELDPADLNQPDLNQLEVESADQPPPEIEAEKEEPEESGVYAERSLVEPAASRPPEEPELPDPNLPGNDWDGDREEATALPPKTKAQPSLLATPLILIGWIKEVVSSFTRPKPSKPVIDIPRRDSAKDSFPDHIPDDIVDTPLESVQAEIPESDDWEQSNWDD